MQSRLARELHESAGVPLGTCGIPEVKKVQAALPDYQLDVISKEHLNALIYPGPEADRCLYPYHHDDHYDMIASMPAFLARRKYSRKCKKDSIKLLTIPVAICASCVIPRTVPSLSGNFANTAIASLKVTNVSVP